jgi:hypothetical protein
MNRIPGEAGGGGGPQLESRSRELPKSAVEIAAVTSDR